MVDEVRTTISNSVDSTAQPNETPQMKKIQNQHEHLPNPGEQSVTRPQVDRKWMVEGGKWIQKSASKEKKIEERKTEQKLIPRSQAGQGSEWVQDGGYIENFNSQRRKHDPQRANQKECWSNQKVGDAWQEMDPFINLPYHLRFLLLIQLSSSECPETEY